jgi:hypothetical protein
MNPNCFVFRNVVLSWLVLAALVTSAEAGTAAKCDVVPTCAKKCGSPSSSGVPCFVRISETGGLSTAIAQNLVGGGAGKPQDPICVKPGTQIIWFSLEESSRFKVDFGTLNPFANTSSGSFAGNQGQFTGDTATLAPHSSGTDCYQYSVQHYSSGHWATADPKVIVDSGRHPKHHGTSETKK